MTYGLLWQSTASVTWSQPCPLGNYSSSRLRAIENDFHGCSNQCPAGFYGQGNTSTCSGICPAGHYCPIGTKYPKQHICPINRYGGAGSTTALCGGGCGIGATTIPNGLSIDISFCICQDSSYFKSSKTKAGTCDQCSAGYYTDRNVTIPYDLHCRTCPKGYYSELTGSNDCTGCPPAKYSAVVGSSLSSSCIACSAGKFGMPAGSITCEDCAAGKYSKDVGQTYCTPCPMDTYRSYVGAMSLSDCLPCTLGKSNGGKVGSTTLNDCQCKSKDYFAVANMTSGEVVCEKCPKGAICSGLGVKIEDVISQPFYWRSQKNSSVFHKCNSYLVPIEEGNGFLFNESELTLEEQENEKDQDEEEKEEEKKMIETSDCIGGYPTKNKMNINTSINQCRNGHSGPVCSLCDPGWARMNGTYCTQCPNLLDARFYYSNSVKGLISTTIVVLFVIIFSILSGCTGEVYKHIEKCCEQKKENIQKEKGKKNSTQDTKIEKEKDESTEDTLNKHIDRLRSDLNSKHVTLKKEIIKKQKKKHQILMKKLKKKYSRNQSKSGSFTTSTTTTELKKKNKQQLAIDEDEEESLLSPPVLKRSHSWDNHNSTQMLRAKGKIRGVMFASRLNSKVTKNIANAVGMKDIEDETGEAVEENMLGEVEASGTNGVDADDGLTDLSEANLQSIQNAVQQSKFTLIPIGMKTCCFSTINNLSSILHHIHTRIKIMIGWIQIISGFPLIMDIPFPPQFLLLLNWTGWGCFNIDLPSLFETLGPCDFTFRFRDRFLLHMSLLPLLLILTGVSYYIIYTIESMFGSGIHNKEDEQFTLDEEYGLHVKQIQDITISNDKGTKRLPTFFSLRKARERVGKVLSTLIFLFYPGLSIKTFQCFKCQEFDPGEYFLSEDLSISCEGYFLFPSATPNFEFVQLEVWGLIAMVVYVMGIPLTTMYILKSNKAGELMEKYNRWYNMEEEEEKETTEWIVFLEKYDDFMQMYGNLCQDYLPHYYYWEIVEMLKKMMLTGGLVLIAPGSSAQILCAVLISLLYLLMVLKVDPYEDRSSDHLTQLTTLNILLTLIAGFAMKTQNPNEGFYEQSMMTFLLIFINVFCWLAALYTFVSAVPEWMKVLVQSKMKQVVRCCCCSCIRVRKIWYTKKTRHRLSISSVGMKVKMRKEKRKEDREKNVVHVVEVKKEKGNEKKSSPYMYVEDDPYESGVV